MYRPGQGEIYVFLLVVRSVCPKPSHLGLVEAWDEMVCLEGEAVEDLAIDNVMSGFAGADSSEQVSPGNLQYVGKVGLG